MWYSHRIYSEKDNDLKMMSKLVIKLNRQGSCDWHLGRLYAWHYGRWTEEAMNPQHFAKRAELFLDATDELVGVVITEGEGGQYFLLADDNPFVLRAMLSFLKTEERFGTPFTINVCEASLIKKEILKEYGFQFSGLSDTTYVYQAGDVVLPDIKLPEGYKLGNLVGHSEPEKIEQLRFEAFNPEMCFTEKVAESYIFYRANKLVEPEDTIVLWNEKGEPISSCIAYMDRSNRSMEVEVVCTAKDYENHGYAKAVISECIKRSISRGIHEIRITGWNERTRKLYASFGKYEVIQREDYK